jgi:cytoskeleton protein RodZ
VPLGERSLPGGPILLVALILAICGYGTWYYLSTGERTRPERVAAVPPALQQQPDQTAAARDGDTAGGASKPAADAATPTNPANPRLSSGIFPGSAAAGTSEPGAIQPSTTPAGTTPAPATPGAAASTPAGSRPIQPSAAAAKAPAPAQTATATAQAPPAPQTAMAAPQAPPTAPGAPVDDGGGAGRIDIRATADCWVQVRGADQSIVFSRVLKAGETYRVPARSGLVMRTGNAGALAITVDGKTAPTLGPLGTLRRNVVLDPAALLGGTAVQG